MELTKTKAESRLEGFTEHKFSYEGDTKPVFIRGKGPAILVMHELPGMIPACVDFARRLADEGFTVYLPLLFGSPGVKYNLANTAAYTARLCVSREFSLLATGKTSPILVWLRALLRQAHQDCGGPGTGAIGMCLTGGFAIPLMLEPALLAPVVSQPSLPLVANPFGRESLGCSEDDYRGACARARSEKIPVAGFRFSHDILSAPEKFERLEKDLGPLFQNNTIYSGPGNGKGIPITAHSVFTVDFKDEKGHPTREAWKKLLSFYQERLAEKKKK